MINFLGNKLQKSFANINKKSILKEEDILVAIKEIKFSLLEADVNLKVVKKFINHVKEKSIGIEISNSLNAYQQFIKIVKDELQILLGSKTKDIKLTKTPTIIMMVGLQGSGKTTTTAKIAKYFMRKNRVKKPLLIAADVYRPAAIDQLETLAKSIKVDVYSEHNNKNVIDIVKAGIKQGKERDNDLIIIDTAGRLAIDVELMAELKLINKTVKPNEILFVMDSLSGQDIINVAQVFNDELFLTGSVITKTDSEARGGAAFSITSILEIPIRFSGTGEKIDDLELFHPDRMAERILGMGDVLTLIEKAEEVIDKDKAKRTINRLGAGHFDLNDLMDQLNQMKKIGKLSKIMKLIPGAKKIPKEKIEEATKKLELFSILIRSMTIEEKKFPRLLKQPKRKTRIISGSGRTNREFNLLVTEFDRMKKTDEGNVESF